MRIAKLRSNRISLILIDIVTFTSKLNFSEKGTVKTGKNLIEFGEVGSIKVISVG